MQHQFHVNCRKRLPICNCYDTQRNYQVTSNIDTSAINNKTKCSRCYKTIDGAENHWAYELGAPYDNIAYEFCILESERVKKLGIPQQRSGIRHVRRHLYCAKSRSEKQRVPSNDGRCTIIIPNRFQTMRHQRFNKISPFHTYKHGKELQMNFAV
ncbi:hypothetical protein GJ496_011803 [Pomphorhynchus laevis]|nr:hypothetical protein GJ496_011803 [Pomphorhynchus laevis]